MDAKLYVTMEDGAKVYWLDITEYMVALFGESVAVAMTELGSWYDADGIDIDGIQRLANNKSEDIERRIKNKELGYYFENRVKLIMDCDCVIDLDSLDGVIIREGTFK